MKKFKAMAKAIGNTLFKILLIVICIICILIILCEFLINTYIQKYVAIVFIGILLVILTLVIVYAICDSIKDNYEKYMRQSNVDEQEFQVEYWKLMECTDFAKGKTKQEAINNLFSGFWEDKNNRTNYSKIKINKVKKEKGDY